MSVRDDIGSRGEYLFAARIMDFCGRTLPYFRPRFLGEKAQTYDYFIELVGQPGFFFVQVKATQKGYTKGPPPRQKVGMSADDVRRLALIPSPTYLVGVDEPGEALFVLAILSGATAPMSSMPTSFPLDCANLAKLFQEVEQFWAGRDMARHHSVFSA